MVLSPTDFGLREKKVRHLAESRRAGTSRPVAITGGPSALPLRIKKSKLFFTLSLRNACPFRQQIAVAALAVVLEFGLPGVWSGIVQPVVAAQEIKPGDSIESLQLTSKAFRQAAEKVVPYLVTIESFGGVSAVQGRIGGIRNQGEGNTTGVLISNEGHIVTSTFNFIQQPPVITVVLADGKRRVAKLLGRDDTRKICLLKIDADDDLPSQFPVYVKPEQVRVGQWAISVGVGYGDTNPAISTGIISAKNRIGGRAIQTDANISPANYGGPLLDIDGNVVGICVPMNPQSQAIGAGVEWYDSGIGFAIPLAASDQWLGRLKEGERISPAFMGVRAAPNRVGAGAYIEEVVKDSPADRAGLEQGNVILAIDDRPVLDVTTLMQMLSRLEAGSKIKVRVMVEDDEKQIEMTLAAPPTAPGQLAPLEPPINR
jgi:serine protease Do